MKLKRFVFVLMLGMLGSVGFRAAQETWNDAHDNRPTSSQDALVGIMSIEKDWVYITLHESGGSHVYKAIVKPPNGPIPTVDQLPIKTGSKVMIITSRGEEIYNRFGFWAGEQKHFFIMYETGEEVGGDPLLKAFSVKLVS